MARFSKPGPISAKPLSVLLGDVFSDAYAKQGFAARELVTRWGEIAGARGRRPFGTPENPVAAAGGGAAAGTGDAGAAGGGPDGAGDPAQPPTSSCSGSTASSAGARWAGWRCGRRRCRAGTGPQASRAPDRKAVAKVAETLASVEDEELRAALARLGASIKRN